VNRLREYCPEDKAKLPSEGEESIIYINNINMLKGWHSSCSSLNACMDIKQIKEIALKYTAEQIEGCITQHIDTGQNVCLADKQSEAVINDLSKADVIRELLDKGMSLADSLRELARRMRLLQQGFQDKTNT
jgi:hypothetical protein